MRRWRCGKARQSRARASDGNARSQLSERKAKARGSDQAAQAATLGDNFGRTIAERQFSKSWTPLCQVMFEFDFETDTALRFACNTSPLDSTQNANVIFLGVYLSYMNILVLLYLCSA